MRVKLIISYDGTKFYGFQRQNDVKNVQGYLENGLSTILKERVVVKGSGRTDRGVHAKEQVVHFDISKSLQSKSVKYLKRYFNQNYPDIRIKKVSVVDASFHARHSVKSKTYLYKIDLSNTLSSDYYLKMKSHLDIKKMRKASKLFYGTHDFHNFVSGNRDNYETNIQSISIYKIGKVLYLKFTGKGFYRYMIRNLVGALIEIGKSNITESVIEAMLRYPEVERRLPTSSPNGLYLWKIRY